MTITLTPEIEAALIMQSQRQGVTPEEVALARLRTISQKNKPQEAWLRLLRSATSDCGVSLADEAVSSEGIYE